MYQCLFILNTKIIFHICSRSYWALCFFLLIHIYTGTNKFHILANNWQIKDVQVTHDEVVVHPYTVKYISWDWRRKLHMYLPHVHTLHSSILPKWRNWFEISSWLYEPIQWRLTDNRMRVISNHYHFVFNG